MEVVMPLSSHPFVILFLSDAHIGNPRHGADPNKVLSSLIDDIKDMKGRLGVPQLIIFGGDLVFGELKNSPIVSQFGMAKTFIQEVYNAADASLELTPLLMVPGNHDINRNLIDKAQDQWIKNLNDPQDLNTNIIENSILWRRLLERQKDWATFYKEIKPEPWSFNEELYLTTGEMNHEGISIGLAGINSSWSCSNESREGSIWIGKHQYETAMNQVKSCQFRIGVWHHPLSWLHQDELLRYHQTVPFDFNLFLHGHEHSQFLSPGTKHMDVASGSCYQGSEFPNAYSWISINFERGDLEIELRTYSDVGKRGWIPYIIPGVSDKIAGKAVFPNLFDPIKMITSPALPEKFEAPEDLADAAEQIDIFQDLCKALKSLLDENHTFFNAFGPNSGANAEGEPRTDLSLWVKAKHEVIAPNNENISSLLKLHKKIIPSSHNKCVERMQAHIFAFGKHCADPKFSYKDYLFPSCFPQMVVEGMASKNNDEALMEIINWISQDIPGKSNLVAAYLFGSTIVSVVKANDVDLAVIYKFNTLLEITEFRSQLKAFEANFKLQFGKSLGVTIFNGSEADHLPDFMKTAGDYRQIY